MSQAMVVQVKSLRDDVARLIGEGKKKDRAIEDALAAAAGERAAREAAEARAEAAEAECRLLRGQLAYYQGPNTPPSRNSIPEMRRRAEARRSRAAGSPVKGGGKCGRKKGHEGESHHRRPDAKEVHRPKRCRKCRKKLTGRARLVFSKLVAHRIVIRRVVYVNHVVYSQECDGCNITCMPDIRGWHVKGTSFTPETLGDVAALHSAPSSSGTVRRQAKELLGIDVCKATVLAALLATSGGLRGIARRIGGGIGRAYYCHMDETPIACCGRQGYVWVAVGRRKDGSTCGVYFVVAPSRAAAVLHASFRYRIPVVADGYSAYLSAFDVIQRCWAHILREARSENERGRAAHQLYVMLKWLYRRARKAGRRGDASAAGWLVDETLRIAGGYAAAGHAAFATKLANAAPNLYTFLSYPGMDMTNNAAERELRHAVIARKVRHGVRSPAGMESLGVMLTCIMTWRARGLGVAESVRRALAGEAVPAS